VVDKKIYVKLFGGEKDGWSMEVPSTDGQFPDMIWVHRNCDDKLLADTEKSDPAHFELLTEALSVLAYEFHSADPKDGVTGGKQFRYDRCASADKAMTDPAV